jgi:probable rRNA maturation factor
MGSTVIFDSDSRKALGRRVTQRSLREFATDLQKRVARGQAFDCLITGDTELRRLNRQYRHKDYPTDVLSFPPAQDGPAASPDEKTLGELAISADRALEQARGCGHPPADELRILMLHGVLHLMGMDHESDNGEMARAELRWRKTFGLPDGLIERARQ